MKWSSRQIDQRNQLHGFMKYQISYKLPEFFEVRSWCWSNFGPGIEYEHYVNFAITKIVPEFGITMPMPKWCWDATKWRGSAVTFGKIYLRNEDDMTLFSLRWS